MNIIQDFIRKVKRRENKFYSAIKSIILFVFNFRIPLFWPLTWIYKGIYYIHIFIRESIITILKIFYFEPMFRSRCMKVGKNLRLEKLPFIDGEGDIQIGSSVNISGRISIGFNDKIGAKPEIVIGDNVFIGHRSGFAIAKKIEVGNNCYISSAAIISDNDGHPQDPEKRKAKKPIDPQDVKPVKLGDNVWVGRGAIILKGVTIGQNSIIGAAAVVTKDVPDNCIVAGNPAAVVKKLG
jgi:acetyltransferase-like isoleucine patch superfamily enzyme